MSCGPAESVGKLVDGINNTVSIVENTIAALPQGVASIPGYAELQLAIQILNLQKFLEQRTLQLIEQTLL